MHSHSTASLLGLKDVKIRKVVNTDHYIKLFIEKDASQQVCPSCGKTTARIHDYRIQEIKDLPFQQKPCSIVLSKRRYRCNSCGKRFYEHYDFAPRYLRRTARLTAFIADSFHENRNMKDVAKASNVSETTVGRILDTIRFPKPSTLPRVFSIDEFKGDANGEKYQIIITDPKKHRVLDILPDRKEVTLRLYLQSFSRFERQKVKFFVSDMYAPYIRVARQYFPNATIIVDKYHFIRQTGWALENTRKRLQKGMHPSQRKYYKRSRTLLLSRFKKLPLEQQIACSRMIFYNEDLRKAHHLKEWFYSICQNRKYSEQRRQFRLWIQEAESCRVAEFHKVAKCYQNWAREICAAFKHTDITNGTTEGFNNRIKVLKRTSYGIHRFERLRTRILMAMN